MLTSPKDAFKVWKHLNVSLQQGPLCENLTLKRCLTFQEVESWNEQNIQIKVFVSNFGTRHSTLGQLKFTFGIINHFVTLFLSNLLLYKVYTKIEFLFKIQKVHSLRVPFNHFQPLFSSP